VISPRAYPTPSGRRRSVAVAAGRAARALALAAAAVGCARGVPPLPDVPTAIGDWPAPARPDGCVEVTAAGDLAGRLARARPGDSFCLAPGEYPGPLSLPERVALWGPRSAVIRGRADGTTVQVAAGAALLGLTVDGSGHRHDLEEAAVHVRGDRARIEGIAIRDALFGLIVERSAGVVVRGNLVSGAADVALGLRGDGIRLWETHDSLVEGNRIVDCRDFVVWYSSDNRIVGNEVRRSRYGTHLMYSHGVELAGNVYVGNVVGVFAMYSRRLSATGNLFAASSGAAGIGLGVKESSDLVVADNVFVRDAVGLYLDHSPFEPGSRNEFTGNSLRLCDVAVGFHSSDRANRFARNSLRGNSLAVRVDGGGDALANEWRENDFDDYQGYDLDRDGYGDLPYELRRYSGQLAARHPELDFFRGAPALSLLDAVSWLAPLYRPQPVLVDARPWMGASRGDALAN
jgi:nitrous oxidase accessory protein